MKNTILLSMAIAVMLFSCSKDKGEINDPVVQAGKQREFLKKSSWKLSAFTIKIGDNPVTNAYDTLSDCLKDDEVNFFKGGELLIKAYTVKCDPTEPDKYKSTWYVSETIPDTLDIKYDGTYSSIQNEYYYHIDQMKDDHFTISRIKGDTTFTKTYTFSH